MALDADAPHVLEEIILSWQVYTWYGLGAQSILDLYPLIHAALRSPFQDQDQDQDHDVSLGGATLKVLPPTPLNAVSTLGLFELAAGAGAHGSLEGVMEQVETMLGEASVVESTPENEILAQITGGFSFIVGFFEALPESALDMRALEGLEATWGGTLSSLVDALWLDGLKEEFLSQLSAGDKTHSLGVDHTAAQVFGGLLDSLRIVLERHRGNLFPLQT